MDEFHFKRITDPVHGTFGIGKLEADIISTPVFQRLHNVKQLGLAHLVYPGAEYSRFSHSLDACHVAGRMMRAINQNSETPRYDSGQIQRYRLAGLLHDIGHYPFSHAMEHVIQNHYKAAQYLAPQNAGDVAPAQLDDNPPSPPSYDHETLGRAIIDHDPDIRRVLDTHKISTTELKAVFSREGPDVLSNLVSSDLDCDRMDYLMRTAHAAGLPYGAVDIEYITSQVCVDSEGHLCLTKRALRAADHFLVSRYYDYTQLVFHKTVVGLEEVLKDVISLLISHGRLDCSGQAMRAKVHNGTFAAFDDQHLIGVVRDAVADFGQGNETFKRKALSVLNRESPKMVIASERIDSRYQQGAYLNNVHQIKTNIRNWADRFSIPEDLWHLWNRSLSLTKIGSMVPFSDHDAFEEEQEQIVRILVTDPLHPNSTSRPLIEHDFALVKQLADVRLYCMSYARKLVTA